MANSDIRLFCRLNELSAAEREQQRMQALAELGLLESENVLMFEEATQTVAHMLETPICILGLMASEQQHLKSAVGLSRLGLMNELATSRKLPRLDSFCTYVVDSQQVLAISDTLNHPTFASSILAHQYGIRAYLGTPLITSTGHCLGTLAVMDVVPRSFTQKDIQFLQLTARWSMSEYERQQISKVAQTLPSAASQPVVAGSQAIAQQLRIDLLNQLSQELCTPLTSVMGMASVLMREIYGPLTGKQKEYLNIIHQSGQYLLSLVNEIQILSEMKDSDQVLNLTSVDIEMLCQQAINTLEQAAHRREQQIRLSVEPGKRVWLLDKNKIQQMLYHLIFSMVQSSTAGSIIRLHVSRKLNNLNIAIWVSHPWLGDGLPYAEASVQPPLVSVGSSGSLELLDGYSMPETNGSLRKKGSGLIAEAKAVDLKSEDSQTLGLELCRQIVEMHGGQLMVQNILETTYRYIISLPQALEEGAS